MLSYLLRRDDSGGEIELRAEIVERLDTRGYMGRLSKGKG
jgi:hypothetical protein